MNESDLDLAANESDPDLGTEEEGIGAEGGEIGAETIGAEEKRVGRRGREAETETDEGEAEARIGRRGRGTDLEKERAAGVATEVDDLEVQLAVVAYQPLNQDINRSMCRLVAGDLIFGRQVSPILTPCVPQGHFGLPPNPSFKFLS